MNFKEIEEYIISLGNRGIVPGLDNIKRLCNMLGNPQDKVKTIHISGTNGKGSVGAFICSILMNAGYNVGRYISPAVENKCEIYQYNAENIGENDYISCINTVKRASDILEKQGCFPTSFEAETAAAFVYFEMKKCDYAIIECGMGGEMDATNVISCPACSVITSVGVDHTAFLGDTVEKIATQKAGIIKSHSRAVCASNPQTVKKVITDRCNEIGVPLRVTGTPLNVCGSIDGISAEYSGINFRTRLAGLYQADNVAVAIETVRMLDLGIDDDVIKKGIFDTEWKYRFEVHGKWVFDGAHNPDGAKRLIETLDKYFSGKRIIYIFGVFRDKEYDKISRITAGRASKIYTIKPSSERGLESDILAETVKRYNKCEVIPTDVETAVKSCKKEKCDAVICFGSLSFLSRLKSLSEVI